MRITVPMFLFSSNKKHYGFDPNADLQLLRNLENNSRRSRLHIHSNEKASLAKHLDKQDQLPYLCESCKSIFTFEISNIFSFTASFIETDNENENERNETQLVADEEDSDNNYQATITQEK
ncbi:unnamed protein product [Didymodactylos carnosus]|uniref:Uncharacterized protein n=1 Tax=Didymodactylos carnosus TaxID=1234261 RepID=A0A8S2FEV6_9BILA|nr:unnamed protein product [Didymodactylos carnosus]CAF4237147.1 unnamed protein product [Didymodactylos carnosus]